MKGKSADTNVDQLLASSWPPGFAPPSRSQCVKALKACHNNTVQAKNYILAAAPSPAATATGPRPAAALTTTRPGGMASSLLPTSTAAVVSSGRAAVPAPAAGMTASAPLDPITDAAAAVAAQADDSDFVIEAIPPHQDDDLSRHVDPAAAASLPQGPPRYLAVPAVHDMTATAGGLSVEDAAAIARLLADDDDEWGRPPSDHWVHRPEGGNGPNGRAAAPKPKSKGPKLHPCVAQYKSCKYGKYCMMRFLPGDVCTNYVVGSCIYGSQCRNKHTVEDPSDAADETNMTDGAASAPRPRRTIDVRVALRAMGYQPGGAAGVDLPPLRVQHPSGDGRELTLTANQRDVIDVTGPTPPAVSAPIPGAWAFNAGATSAPSWSEPLAPQASVPMNVAAAHANLPAPFRDRLVATKNAVRATPAPTMGGSRVVVSATSAAADPVHSPSSTFSPSLHPCVRQMGDCKYGSTCRHAHIPDNVCVHWLNGRCHFAAEHCLHLHALPGSREAEALNRPTPNYQMTPSKPSQPTLSDVVLRQAAAAKPSSKKTGWAAFSSGAAGPPAATSHPSPPTVTAIAVAPAPVDETETEMAAFAALQKVFPDADHFFILHALRLTNNDRQKVADVILRCASLFRGIVDDESPSAATSPTQGDAADGTSARRDAWMTSDDVEALLRSGERSDASSARSLASTAEPALPVAVDAADLIDYSSSDLLTLCALFPAMEPSALEEVLAACGGDIAVAIGIVLCQSEGLPMGSSTPTGRIVAAAAMPGAERTPREIEKSKKLHGMFPSCSEEVATVVLAAYGWDLPGAISCMNALQAAENAATEPLSPSAPLSRKGRRSVTRIQPLTQRRVAESLLSAAAVQVTTRSSLTLTLHPRRSPPLFAAPRVVVGSAAGSAAPPPAGVVASFETQSAPPEAVSAETAGPTLVDQRRFSSSPAYLEACEAARTVSDWRRVRHEAYEIHRARCQVVSYIATAYQRGDHATGKSLAAYSRSLGREYQRLNLIAMLSLERERASSGELVVLDLHGFHLAEAIDVLTRRIAACAKVCQQQGKRSMKLRVVIGQGLHSDTGRSVIYPQVVALALAWNTSIDPSDDPNGLSKIRVALLQRNVSDVVLGVAPQS